MKAFLLFTEGEPRIVAMPRKIVVEGRLAENLSKAGFDRFIAHEVSVDRLRETYGVWFEAIEAEIRAGKNLRVVDSNGLHALAHVEFSEIGPGFAHGL